MVGSMANEVKLTLSLEGDNVVVKGIERVGQAADSAKKSFSNWKSSVADIAHIGGALTLAGQAVSAFGGTLTNTASALANAAIASDKLSNTLKFATGGAGAAANGYSYIVEVSNRLGLSLDSAGQAFAKLQASAVGTSLAGEGARKIFESVASASMVMGLSADETGGALNAIGQIMSKGKVSAEELRGQLGERLPGAFQIAARAMGVTTAELDKLLTEGKLMSEDFLPKFAEELRRTLGDAPESAAKSAQAQINRLSTEWEIFKRNVADTSAFKTAMAVVVGVPSAMLRAVRGASTDEKIKEQWALVDDYKSQGYGPAAYAGNLREIARLQAEKKRLEESAIPAAVDNSYDNKEARRAAATTPRVVSSESIAAWDKFNKTLRTDAEKTAELIKEARALADAAGKDPASAIARIQKEAAEKASKKSGAAFSSDEFHNDNMIRYGKEVDKEIADRAKQANESARANAAMAQTVDNLTDAYTRQNAVAKERSMSVEERELAGALRQVEEQADRAREALSAKAATISGDNVIALDSFRRSVISVSEAEANQAAQVRANHEERLRQNQDWKTGFTDALSKYEASSRNVAQTASDAFTSAFGSMESAIVEFTMTGKLAYKDMARSILADLSRIYAKQAVMGLVNMATSVAGAYFGGAGSGYGQTSAQAATGADINSAGMGGFANGGAFDRTAQAFAMGGAFGNGEVLTSPTPFFFADGGAFRRGVAGEAGPEGALPLKRMAGGKLGVYAELSGGAGGGVQINVNVNIASDGSAKQDAESSGSGANAKALGQMVGNACRQVLVQEMRSGGMLDRLRAA